MASLAIVIAMVISVVWECLAGTGLDTAAFLLLPLVAGTTAMIVGLRRALALAVHSQFGDIDTDTVWLY